MKLCIPSILLGFLLMTTLSFRQVIQPIQILSPEQKAVLDLLSVEMIDDCQGGPGYKTLRVTGANFQVVNGLGTTDTENGLGNILVGYQESQAVVCDRTGSHNIVGGLGNAYGSYGGLVMGLHNYVDAGYSAILSGAENTIMTTPHTQTPMSAIIGGQWNTTTSDHCVVVGGGNNFIDGAAAIGSARWSVLVGGGGSSASNGNLLQSSFSCLVGGNQNTITSGNSVAVLVGGQLNTVSGTAAVLSGGFQRSATGVHDWVSGSLLEDN